MRKHEYGGVSATGTLTGNYTEGQVVWFTVALNTTHYGRYRFRVCVIATPKLETELLTEECLDEHTLVRWYQGSSLVIWSCSSSHARKLVLLRRASHNYAVARCKRTCLGPRIPEMSGGMRPGLPPARSCPTSSHQASFAMALLRAACCNGTTSQA